MVDEYINDLIFYFHLFITKEEALTSSLKKINKYTFKAAKENEIINNIKYIITNKRQQKMNETLTY